MNVASIDIGTNTVLLLIAEFDFKHRKLKPLLNVHRMPRIGIGLLPGSNISSEKIVELKNILLEYKAIIKSYNVEQLILTATNAFRISANSNQIVNEIRNEFNFDIKIISGEDEANYAFLGATFDITLDREFLVIDIGGGSTEIIAGSMNNITYRQSFQIGSVSATEEFLPGNPPDSSHIEKLNHHLQSVFRSLKKNDFKECYPIAIAGTPTTLSCIKHNLTDFDYDTIELSCLKIDEINSISNQLSILTNTEIDSRWSNIMRGRADIILAGSRILSVILSTIKIDKVYTSTKGIRYGAIIQHLINQKIL